MDGPGRSRPPEGIRSEQELINIIGPCINAWAYIFMKGANHETAYHRYRPRGETLDQGHHRPCGRSHRVRRVERRSQRAVQVRDGSYSQQEAGPAMMISLYRVVIKTGQDTIYSSYSQKAPSAYEAIRIAGSIVPNLDDLYLKSITVERTEWCQLLGEC